MDHGHKARKDPSDNADLDYQAVCPALHIAAERRGAAASKTQRHPVTCREASHCLHETSLSDDTLQMKMLFLS